MSWWSDFADAMECDTPLPGLTWFRLGGKARFLCRPHDAKQLAAISARARQENVPVKVLGAGANVLVRDDGFDGVVVRLDQPEFKSIRWHDDRVTLGAGVDLMPLVRSCSNEGWTGLEGLAGIPASIGGAVCMNAGGRYGDIADVIVDADLLDENGHVEKVTKQGLGLSYRHSDIANRVVVGATVQLRRDDPAATRKTFEAYWQQKRATQPIAQHSAGCIFKNPPGQSAGALIDRAGLKGTRCGYAKVSEQHANFIVADHGATSSDVLRLIDVVRDRVQREFGTQLETEIDIW